MNRKDKRLFEIQLKRFYDKFKHFTNYQLELISSLCLKIIEERKTSK